MKQPGRCHRCGGMTTEEPKSGFSVITCMECGDVDYNRQSGYDDGPDAADRVREFQDEFDEEDEEDDEAAPEEWWEGFNDDEDDE